MKYLRSSLNGLLLFLFVILVDICYAAECGQQEFAQCAEPLDKLQLISEFQIGKNEQLNELCAELRKSLKCIQSYTRRCLNIDQRNYFNTLYHGTNQFIRDLCNDETFQQEYLKHSTCSQVAKTEFEVCANRYKNALVFMNPISNGESQENLTHADNIKTICCSYQELIECSEQVASYKCGNDAAKFVKDLLSRVGNSLVRLHCDKYSREPELCGRTSSGYSVQPILITFIATALVSTLKFVIR